MWEMHTITEILEICLNSKKLKISFEILLFLQKNFRVAASLAKFFLGYELDKKREPFFSMDILCLCCFYFPC